MAEHLHIRLGSPAERVAVDDGRETADDAVVEHAVDAARDAVDSCFAGSPGPAAPGAPATSGGQQITDPGQCNALYPFYSLTRPAAGAPATDDVIQCALSPIDPKEYLPAVLSDEQLKALKTVFPHGVCDYTKTALGQQHSIPWMSFEDGPGGKPLGAAPTSVPFGPPGVTVLTGGGKGGKACRGKRAVKVRIRARKGTRIRRVTIYVNGHKVKTFRGKRKAVRLKLAPRKAGKARVLVVVNGVRKGKRVKIRSRHTYRTCTHA